MQSIQERWQFDVDGTSELLSAATVVDGTAYIGSSSNFVYAVDTATGERRWRFQTGNSIRSTPAVADGTVYVSSTDAAVYALSTDQGSEQWRVSLGLPVHASPTPAGDSVYVGGRNGEVYALDAETGEIRWTFTTNDPIYGSVAVVDGTVYGVNEPGTVFALDAEEGRPRWQTRVEGNFDSAPVVADGMLYLTSTTDQVLALSTQSGERQWSKDIPIRAPANVAVTESILAVPGSDGTLYALDPRTGAEQYQFNAGARCYSPTVSDGVLCVGVSDGIRSLDPATSAQHWSHRLGPSTHPSLSVSNGVVYAGGENGTLYAVVGDETPAPQTNSSGAATRTPTETASASGSQSEDDPTQTATPAITTEADVTTSGPVTEGSQGSPVRQNRMIVRGIGSAVIGSILLAGYLGLRATSDSDAAGVTRESRNRDTNRGKTGDDSDIAETTDIDELVGEATAALDEGQRAKERGEYGRAATQLEDAVETFDRALPIADADRTEELRDELETAKAALLDIDSIRQTLDDVEELLAAAEEDMENAIVAFANDQLTVARVRFRQARGRYERAIELLDEDGIEQLELSVDVSTDETLDEIDTFDEIPNIDTETIDSLRDAGYETPTDLRGLSVEELSRTADVDDETAARLKILSWQTPSGQRQFESVDDVTARLESATLGYRFC